MALPQKEPVHIVHLSVSLGNHGGGGEVEIFMYDKKISVLSSSTDTVAVLISQKEREMQYQLFNTPVVTPILRVLSAITLKLLGWKVVGNIPERMKKCVVIGAPHTSNWDFPIFLMTAFVLRVNIRWIGKHTLFHFPFHSLMTWLGGMPIDRRVRGDMVAKASALFRDVDEFVLGISPEGTRKATPHWHTGFWYIAQSAHVPIFLAFIDYRAKQCGFHGEFHSTGDIELDMNRIKDFFSKSFRGKRPHNFTI